MCAVNKNFLILVLLVFFMSNVSFGAQNFDNEHKKTAKEIQNYLKHRKDFSQISTQDNFVDLLTKAQIAEQNGDYYGAINYYDKMIELDPKNSAIYSLRGMIHQKLNLVELAIEDYTNAIKLNPNDSNNYTMRGIARMRLGDKDGAYTDLTKAIDINKQKGTPQALPYCVRGLINLLKKNDKAAIEDTTQSIKLQPKNPQAFHYRGLSKMSLAVKQLSMQTMDSSIQDLNYAKEQSLQEGDMAEYQNVLKSYKRALAVKQVLQRELNKKK